MTFGSKVVEHRVEAGRRERGALFGRLFLTIFRHFAGTLFIFDHCQNVAGARHAAKAQHLDRHGRASLLDLLACIVDDSAHTAAFGAHHEGVAAFQRAARDEHGRDRATALVELCLDHGCLGHTVGARLQFEQFGLKRDLLEQFVQPGLLLCGDLHVLHIARHLLHDHLVFEQAVADVVRIGFRLVHLVDGHDHRDARGLGVIDGLDRLRHDAVIRGHHQHHDIGDIRTALAHFGEGGVARCVEEGDLVAGLGLHLIAADMLRDAARFALGDIGTAKRVEQAGLAVVDMAHDGDDRRTLLERFFRIDVLFHRDIDIGLGDLLDVVTELFHQQFRRILVDRLVDGDHHVEIEELLHEVGALLAHTLGQFADRDSFGHDDVAGLLFAWLVRTATLQAALLLARTLERGETAGAAAFILVERFLDRQLARTALVRLFRIAIRLVVLLLGTLGLLDFGTLDRCEPARGRRGGAVFLRCFRLCLGNRCFRRFGSLLGLFLGTLGGLGFCLFVIGDALLLVGSRFLGALVVALAGFLRQTQALFLGLALETRNTFLRRFGRGCSLLGRRGLALPEQVPVRAQLPESVQVQVQAQGRLRPASRACGGASPRPQPCWCARG